MDSLTISLLILLFVFSIISIYDVRKGLILIIFTLSFSVPFKSELLPIGMPGLFILILSAIIFVKDKRFLLLTKFSGRLNILYFLLVMGLIVGLFNSVIVGKDFSENSQSNIEQILSITSFCIVIILFIKILIKYRYEFDFQLKLNYVFCFSIIVHLLTYLLFKSEGASNRVFYYSDHDTYITGVEILRFVSLIGDYELTIDYVLIIIGICAACSIRRSKSQQKSNLLNLVYIILCALAVFVGLATGTRSFLLIGGLYFILVLLFIASYKYKIIFISITLISTCLLIIYSIKFEEAKQSYAIFARLGETLEKINDNESVGKIANRDLYTASVDLISSTGLLGNGAFYITEYNKNEMVSHNLFLAVYAKYGVIGIFFLMTTIVYFFQLLIRIVRYSTSDSMVREAKLFLILLLCLLLQELKISSLRNVSILLIYVYFFYNVYCLYLRSLFYKVIQQWCKSA